MPSARRSPARRTRTAVRFAVAAPARARGRETLDRFAAATEELLRTTTFERLSIHDIVARAGRPIGSFYARFASKEAILPVLYERYDRELEARFRRRFAPAGPAPGLPAAVARVVGAIAGLYLERRWLVRAMAIFARTSPEAIPAVVIERRRTLLDPAVRLLLEHRPAIAHADPEGAVRFALFAAMCVARERLLFGDAPLARVTPQSRAALERELARMVLAYLAGPPAPARKPARARVTATAASRGGSRR